MVEYQIDELILPYQLKAFDAKVLRLTSQVLRQNPLDDPTERHNYLLLPKGRQRRYPVIFHLSGFFSTGHQAFAQRTLAQNVPQWLDEDTSAGQMPKAIHVFVDAMTCWGGSQFIDSSGSGHYGEYLLRELCPAVGGSLPTTENWWLVGGSSGGYGALQLVSQPASPFVGALAIAPDSFFAMSLLPELVQMAAQLSNFKDVAEIRGLVARGEIQDKPWFFRLMNVIAMAHCYSPPMAITRQAVQWPIDLTTGEVNLHLWDHWLTHDPIYFLPARGSNLAGKKIYLDVGQYDEYSLQFGARQIANLLQSSPAEFCLTEFSGTHRGLSERRRWVLRQYGAQWGK